MEKSIGFIERLRNLFRLNDISPSSIKSTLDIFDSTALDHFFLFCNRILPRSNMSVKTTQAWQIVGSGSFDNLKFNEKFEVPEVTDHDVLVKFHSASLNFRDLVIPLGKYPFAQRDGVVPGSDGAGEVIAVGSKVTRVSKGDKVVTLFNQGHLAGSLDLQSAATGVGGMVDGTLARHGVFNENGLVLMPSTLSYQEASTLPCAALTAWNALYGLRPLVPGEYVLTQGTGGVSIFAVQFALAAGAKVIATTSSKDKEETLKKLGAHHIINYKENPEWGVEAKKITGGQGVDNIIEVGGARTMAQSLEAIKIDGIISIIGFRGGDATEKEPSFLEALSRIATVRGLFVGSRLQFEQMNAAIEANNIKPVIDEKVFTLEQLKEAYQYMWESNHFGKLTIKID